MLLFLEKILPSRFTNKIKNLNHRISVLYLVYNYKKIEINLRGKLQKALEIKVTHKMKTINYQMFLSLSQMSFNYKRVSLQLKTNHNYIAVIQNLMF